MVSSPKEKRKKRCKCKLRNALLGLAVVFAGSAVVTLYLHDFIGSSPELSSPAPSPPPHVSPSPLPLAQSTSSKRDSHEQTTPSSTDSLAESSAVDGSKNPSEVDGERDSRSVEEQKESLASNSVEEPVVTFEMKQLLLAHQSGFALIPRPVYFEQLKDLKRNSSDPKAFQNAKPGLRWNDESSEKVRRETTGRMEDALQPLEELLGLSAERMSKGDAITRGVTVLIETNFEDARAACRRATSLGSELHSTNRGVPSTKTMSEWHMAVLVDGCLVVCALDPQGIFRFAMTLQQVLHVGLLPSKKDGDTAASDSRCHGSGELGGACPASSQHRVPLKHNLDTLPNFVLEDWPHYSWRGLQLDTVRHFMPVSFIKRYLHAMSKYKANMFHWHLTDDQAWRLYLKSRPRLVNASAQTSPEFYSHNDVHEVISLASQLFITVVPVIETPGHSLAALVAYPELACEGNHFEVPKTRVGTYSDILCVAKDEVIAFAKSIFAEVASLFPGPYVHIGGDEIPMDKWQRSPDIKRVGQQKGWTNHKADVLEWWFCEVGKMLKEHGKTVVMWDDHFERRDRSVGKKCPNAENDWIVQAWKLHGSVGTPDLESLNANFKFRAIASPIKSCYLDYPVASIDYHRTLKFEPVKAKSGASSRALGGCANMWTEDSAPEDVGAKVYPRYLGLAERLWGAVEYPDNLQRILDLRAGDAARRHCNELGPLFFDFGFKCGKFELRMSGRSDFWREAKVTTTMHAYEPAYNPDRALDDEDETYFWAVAPKQGDKFDVWFTDRSSSRVPKGRLLKFLRVTTGCKDRPADKLYEAELLALQWRYQGQRSYSLGWSVLGVVDDAGNLEANVAKLAQGNTVGLRIQLLKSQTQWATIREIIAVEDIGGVRPNEDELQLSAADRTQLQGSPLL